MSTSWCTSATAMTSVKIEQARRTSSTSDLSGNPQQRLAGQVVEGGGQTSKIGHLNGQRSLAQHLQYCDTRKKLLCIYKKRDMCVECENVKLKARPTSSTSDLSGNPQQRLAEQVVGGASQTSNIGHRNGHKSLDQHLQYCQQEAPKRLKSAFFFHPTNFRLGREREITFSVSSGVVGKEQQIDPGQNLES